MAFAVTQPALTSAAIIAALGFTPASSTMADGSAAAPSLAFATATDMGFFKVATNTLGIAAAGKPVAEFQYRDLGYQNARLILGTGTNVSDVTQDTFLATINTPSFTVTGAAARPVAFNMGTITVTNADTTTKTAQFAMLEMDKFDIYARNGSGSTGADAVILNRVVNTRFRFHIPYEYVTLVTSVGIDFVMPNVTATGAAVTNYRAINIPSMTGSGGTNFTGMFFNNDPSKGGISSADGVNLSMWAGSAGSSTANLVLGSTGSSGRVKLQNQGVDVIVAGTSGGGAWLEANVGGSVPVWGPNGAASDIHLGLYSKGANSVILGSQLGTGQVRVTHTASANRYISLTGSNGGNPTISVSAGALAVGAELVTLASATGTAGFNLPHGTAPTSPANGDMWTTTSGLFVQINGVTKTVTLT